MKIVCLLILNDIVKLYNAGPLGLMGRNVARQTSEPGSNPSWDNTVHPVCETFNIMRAFKNHYIKCTITGPITS